MNIWLKQLSMVGVKLQLCNLAVCIFARAVTNGSEISRENKLYESSGSCLLSGFRVQRNFVRSWPTCASMLRHKLQQMQTAKHDVK